MTEMSGCFSRSQLSFCFFRVRDAFLREVQELKAIDKLMLTA